MDVDQAARSNAQEYFGVKDPDYYEFEGAFLFFDHLILQLKSIKYFLQENIFSFYYFSAHVFIDDGMEENKSQDRQCNRFVKQLVDVIELAAT